MCLRKLLVASTYSTSISLVNLTSSLSSTIPLQSGLRALYLTSWKSALQSWHDSNNN